MSSASHAGIDPPNALSQRVRSELRSQRTTALRPHLRNVAALIGASIISVSVIATASQLVYGDYASGLQEGVKSAPLLACVAIALLSLLFAATFAALWRGRSGLGASIPKLAAISLAVAPLYALLVLGLPVHEAATGVGTVDISPWGARCFGIAAFIGLAVLGCFGLAMRAAAPVGARIRSAVLGSAAGAWAGVAVFLFCPSGDALHLSVGHVLPVVTLTIVGAVALPRVLRP